MQINRDKGSKSIDIHQRASTEGITETRNTCNANGINVPCSLQSILYPVSENVFGAVVSCPSIASVVNNISEFLSEHDSEYWQEVKRIFAYLVGKKDIRFGSVQSEGFFNFDSGKMYSVTWHFDHTRKSIHFKSRDYCSGQGQLFSRATIRV